MLPLGTTIVIYDLIRLMTNNHGLCPLLLRSVNSYLVFFRRPVKITRPIRVGHSLTASKDPTDYCFRSSFQNLGDVLLRTSHDTCWYPLA